MTARARILVALIAVAPLTACGSSGGGSNGAGGSTTTSPTAYVHDICSAIASGGKQIMAQEKKFETTVRADEQKGLATVKQDTISYFDAVTAKVEAMKNGVVQAGTPDVSGGAGIRTRLVNGMTQLVDTMHKVQSEVRSISSSNPQQFASQIQSDASKVQTVFSQVGHTFDALSNKQLNSAANSDSACKSLSSGSF